MSSKIMTMVFFVMVLILSALVYLQSEVRSAYYEKYNKEQQILNRAEASKIYVNSIEVDKSIKVQQDLFDILSYQIRYKYIGKILSSVDSFEGKKVEVKRYIGPFVVKEFLFKAGIMMGIFMVIGFVLSLAQGCVRDFRTFKNFIKMASATFIVFMSFPFTHESYPVYLSITKDSTGKMVYETKEYPPIPYVFEREWWETLNESLIWQEDVSEEKS